MDPKLLEALGIGTGLIGSMAKFQTSHDLDGQGEEGGSSPIPMLSSGGYNVGQQTALARALGGQAPQQQDPLGLGPFGAGVGLGSAVGGAF